ncbi:hypothetical protein KSP40_PGU001072 [Platanthera guangdongensis]|uniref:Uncharacterized protein n=1 Tax=Platanthera guangdongensis TaxID=2320717 RepID=A0ABR2LD15_9ASPA
MPRSLTRLGLSKPREEGSCTSTQIRGREWAEMPCDREKNYWGVRFCASKLSLYFLARQFSASCSSFLFVVRICIKNCIFLNFDPELLSL